MDRIPFSRRDVFKTVPIGLGIPAGMATRTRAQQDLRSIEFGETKEGTLDSGDQQDPDVSGFYYEPVTFTGAAGDEVTLAYTSEMFDPIITYVPPSGGETEFGGLANPVTGPPYEKEDTITLSETGRFELRIKNSEVGSLGTYQITLTGSGDWASYGDNPANTGYDPAVVGPSESITEQWSFTTNDVVSEAPVVTNGTVYAVSRDGNLYALDAADGTEQWRFERDGSPYPNAPAVDNGTVYVADDGLNALDSSDGSVKWTFEKGGSIPTPDGDTVYVGGGTIDTNVYAVDASDGSKLWEFTTGAHVNSAPAIVDGTAYYGSADNTIYALDASTGSKQWEYDTVATARSPVVIDGTVYSTADDFGDETNAGEVYAVDATDGTERWVTRIEDTITEPSVANGVVYVGCSDFKLYALDATDGSILWTAETGLYANNGSPTIANGVVYKGSRDDKTYAFDAQDGTILWEFQTGGFVNTSPAIDNGTVYIGSSDNNVYALTEYDGAEPDPAFTVSPSNPTVGEEVTFDGAASTGSGSIDSYEWTFGDGTTATGQSVTHAYGSTGSNDVSLTIQYDSNTKSTTRTVDVFEEDTGGDAGVSAAFEYGPDQPTADEAITFDAGPTEGSIEEYEWTFGIDRSSPPTATGKETTHTFAGAGSYEVELRVTGRPADNPDAELTVDTSTASVVVEETEDGTTISDISVSPSNPAATESVTFEAHVGDDSGAQIDWTFGDGASATGETVVHSYESAGTYEVQASSDTESVSQQVEVGDRSIRVEDVSRRVGGELLPGLPIEEEAEATVQTDSDTSLDTVDFELNQQTDSSTAAPHETVLAADGFDAPGETLLVRATSADGVVHEHTTDIPVTDLTDWLEFLLGLDEVLSIDLTVTEDGATIDILYDPLGALDVGIELPENVAGSSADASDRTQSFGFGGIDFGGSYDPIARSARLRGAGEISADMMRAEVTAGVRASGTVTSDLELIDPVGGVNAEVSVTIPSLGPVPLSIPIPGTDSTIGIEPTITPGIDGEFRFSNEFDFQDGTITPSITIRIETGVEVENPVGPGSVGLSVATEGDFDIEFEVGNGEPEPLGEITITGEITLGLGLEFVIEGEIISATFGPGAQSQQVALADGLDYELRQSSTGGKQALPEVDSVDSGAVAAAATDPLSTTETGELYRLTDREYEDTEPSVAVLDDGTYMVAWSQQAADKPADAGRDLVVRTYDGGSWSDPTILTDDSTSDTAPVIAATDDGRAMAAWITYDIDATEQDPDSDTYLAASEVVYAVYDGNSWSEPTTLTDTDVRQQRPTIAADENGWLLAWQSLDTSTSPPSSTVRVARVPDATTTPTVQDWAEGATPSVGARSDSGVDLAYVRTSDDTVTGVVHQHVIGTSVENETTYDTTADGDPDPQTVVATDGRVVWSAGGQDTRRIVDAGGGTRTELDVREEVTTVGELSLATVGDRTVLSYRASFTDSDNRDLVYRLDPGTGWIRDRRIAGGPAREETLWHSETAPLPTGSTDTGAFLTAYAVSEPDPDAVDDVFLTEHAFAPDYALDASVDAAAAGQETTVSYTIENRGDRAGSDPVTVTVKGADSQSIEESGLDAEGTASGTATVTVPEDGLVDVSLSVSGPNLGTEPTARQLVAASPALRVAGVDAVRRDRTTADVTITVRNAGDAVASSVPISVRDSGTELSGTVLDPIDPGATATVELTVDPTALDDDTPQAILIDPDEQLPSRAIDDGRKDISLVRPDLSIEDIHYREDNGVPFVAATVSNAGAGDGEGTYRVVDANGTQLGTETVAIDAAIEDEPRFDRVLVRAPGLSTGDVVEHRIGAQIGNLNADGLVQEESVDAIVPGTFFTLDQYAGPDGQVALGNVRTAVSDWQDGNVGTDLLTQLLDAWSSGDPIE